MGGGGDWGRRRCGGGYILVLIPRESENGEADGGVELVVTAAGGEVEEELESTRGMRTRRM